MASDTVLGALTLRYAELDARTREQVEAALATSWETFWSKGDWTASTQAEATAGFWALARTEQLTEMNATLAYLSMVESQVVQLGIPAPRVSPEFRSSLTSQGVRDADPLEVYGRPFSTVRYQLSKGTPFPEAKRQGLDRLQTISRTDAQLAKTKTSREVMRTRSGVALYRRVPTGKSCDLCIVASEHYYVKKNLLPIHANCDCIVLPLYKGMPQADAYDNNYQDRLDNAFRTLDEQGASKGRVKRAQNLVNESRQNDEYGPVITWAKHNFSTEAELAG